jgi:glycine betaine/choline ABC-type transport system substrate-binding protein
MKHKIVFILSSCIILLLSLAVTGQACVGRILTLSVNDTVEQKIIGQLLATYVTERTGSTVNLVTVSADTANEEQIKEAKADIILDYLNVGLAKIEGADKSGEAQKNYGLVKQYYIDTFAIVWLRPLGYKGPLSENATDESLSLAIPVTTREVLNRFPVLDRVINKLGGRIDARTLQQLIKASETDEITDVVKNFLKDQNLI